MGRILVAEHRWPLVVVEWPDVELSDQDIVDFFECSLEQLQRKERHVALHLSIKTTGMSSKHRRMMGDFVNQHRVRVAKYMAASAVVAPSRLIRGMVTAVNWIAPPPSPQGVFANEAEALDYLRQYCYFGDLYEVQLYLSPMKPWCAVTLACSEVFNLWAGHHAR
jgi:hypothetical protein